MSKKPPAPANSDVPAPMPIELIEAQRLHISHYGFDVVLQCGLVIQEQTLWQQPGTPLAAIHACSIVNRSGSYIVKLYGNLVYAGSSIKAIRRRFSNIIGKLPIVPAPVQMILGQATFHHLECSPTAALALEQFLIARYNPPLNGSGLGNNALGKNRQSQTLATYLHKPGFLRLVALCQPPKAPIAADAGYPLSPSPHCVSHGVAGVG